MTKRCSVFTMFGFYSGNKCALCCGDAARLSQNFKTLLKGSFTPIKANAKSRFFVYVSALVCEYTVKITLDSLELLVTGLRFQFCKRTPSIRSISAIVKVKWRTILSSRCRNGPLGSIYTEQTLQQHCHLIMHGAADQGHFSYNFSHSHFRCV